MADVEATGTAWEQIHFTNGCCCSSVTVLFFEASICYPAAPKAIHAYLVFTCIFKPDHWELGSANPSRWGSQAKFAQMTWVKHGAEG